MAKRRDIKTQAISRSNATIKKKMFRFQSTGGDAFRRNLLIVPFLALITKLIIIANINATAWPGVDPEKYRLANFWMGADGENYVAGLNGIVRDGFLSKEGILVYWPAGYPILLYFFGLPFRSWTLVSTGLIQTLIYAIAAAYFVDTLARTRLRKFSVVVAVILGFNPTLSLASYSIGYESLTASLVLVAIGLMIKEYKRKKSSLLSKESILAASALSLASFMQPRIIVTGFVLFFVWALATRTRLVAVGFMTLTMGFSLFLPALLVVRNSAASDLLVVSTNLGGNMKIGAGPKTDGSYASLQNQLQCPEVAGDAGVQDRTAVACVVQWYLDNPSKIPILFARKAFYFWSPWFGPLATGTMARNPWNLNHPLRSTAQSPEGYDLIFGMPGKVLSWMWVTGCLGFMLYGFLVLWRLNGLERLLGITLLGIILINMGVALATFGDHRFRLPTAGLSLFLQAVGLIWALGKGKRKALGPREELLWKSFSRATNLGS